MAKIGKVILTVYLTLVTLGCALFRYLYISEHQGNNSNNGQVMSITNARSLINTVCEDLGWFQSKNAKNGVSTQSKNYVDYDTASQDEENGIIFPGCQNLMQMFIGTAKYALDGDVKEDTYFISNARATVPGTGGYVTQGSMKLYFELKVNSVEIHILDNSVQKEFIIFLKNNLNDSDWEMNIYGNMGVQYDSSLNGYTYANIIAKQGKIYSSHLVYGTYKDNGEEDVRGISICKVNEKKKLDTNALTEEEKLEYAQDAISKVDAQKFLNWPTNDNAYIKNDALAKLYEYIGYEDAVSY